MDKIAQGLVSALKSTDWDDDVQRRFEQDLSQLAKGIRSFKSQADAAEKHLQRKAGELENYLRR